jgi:hypothetical protein
MCGKRRERNRALAAHQELFRDGQHLPEAERSAWRAGECSDDLGLLGEVRWSVVRATCLARIIDDGAAAGCLPIQPINAATCAAVESRNAVRL